MPEVLRYWELRYIISETSIAFLDIKVSINGNGLSTSVHYKPTDSHSYLLHSSSHPSHVKNSIPISQFLRRRRLCSDVSDIFPTNHLVSFKRAKNIGNFLVRSVLKSDDQPGTFKCARKRCNTCPFIHDADKITGPKRSIKITDRFTCTSANVIYCITCTLCKKIYIGETGRRLGDRFREHIRDVERNDEDASKPVARHFNLPNHSSQHMTICGLSLHQGNTESRKNLEQKFIFQIGTLNPHGIKERFSFN